MLFIRAVLIFFLFTSLYSKEKLKVTVSILPQKVFVEKIAKEYAEITTMVLPSASPHTYEPKPSQMMALSKSDLYFAIGAPFEKTWLPRFKSQNQNIKIIYTQKDIKLLESDIHDHHDHEGCSGHGEKDPHIWLSPVLVKTIAKNTLDALSQAMPNKSKIFEKNYQIFLNEIDKTDKEIRDILSGLKNSPFMVFHPSWGYFAKEYGLVQLPIEIEGKEPKPSQLAALIKRAKKEKIKAIFTQPEFSQKAAQTIAKELEIPVVSISTLSDDWPKNIVEFAKTIKGR